MSEPYIRASSLSKIFKSGAADLVAHHSLPTVAVVGVLALLGFAWWWKRKKRAGKLLED